MLVYLHVCRLYRDVNGAPFVGACSNANLRIHSCYNFDVKQFILYFNSSKSVHFYPNFSITRGLTELLVYILCILQRQYCCYDRGSPGAARIVDNVPVERRRMAKASRNIAQLTRDQLMVIYSSGDT